MAAGGKSAEQRAFTWFPKLTRVLQALPAENVAEFAMAIAEYGTNGADPSFSSPILAAVFEGVREDIDNSTAARYRNKGGRPKKSTSENGGFEVSETQETPVSQNGNQFPETKTPVTGSENMGEEVSESGNPSYINQAIPNQAIPNQAIPNQAIPNQAIPNQTKPSREHPQTPSYADFDEPGEFERFAAACIDAFNDETGKDYRSSGGEDWLGLRRIYDNGRTVDDVRSVVRCKLAEWGRDPKWAKYVRPSTLFGPRFEEYLAQCGPIKPPRFEACPECGHAMVPIGEVVDKPKDPSRLFCEHCRKSFPAAGRE